MLNFFPQKLGSIRVDKLINVMLIKNLVESVWEAWVIKLKAIRAEKHLHF